VDGVWIKISAKKPIWEVVETSDNRFFAQPAQKVVEI
jgi:hypothetical protein